MATSDTRTMLAVAFRRLNITQALGTLNDNLLKLLIVFFALLRSADRYLPSLPPSLYLSPSVREYWYD